VPGSLDDVLDARLGALRAAGLGRALRRIDGPAAARVRTGGRTLANFSGNDYLGLAAHPATAEAAARAARDHGAGATASRLVCGSLSVHHALEETLAEFKGLPAALVFNSGHAAALGTIPALVGPGDLVVLDRLVHACCIDAARLSGARIRVFAHNDVEALGRVLARAAALPRRADGGPRVLVVTEAVFSMDGDTAPLADIVAAKERHGAWLMLDEAHATGVLGPRGRGLAASLGLSDAVEVHMGTLGKALGAAGGFIAGSRALIDTLVNRARSFLFSTAPVPAAAAAAHAALAICREAEGDRLRAALTANIAGGFRAAVAAGFAPRAPGHILPLMIGTETAALDVAAALDAAGVLAPAIRFPTVARGAARIRLAFSAAHAPEDLARLGDALRHAAPAPPPTA
jgi:8-amino-7-oxononanoate synthase